MGKFLGSFTGSKQQQNSSSRPGSACASPVSTAPVSASGSTIAPSAPQLGPLTLGHQAAAKEQQLLPHMVADVTEDADRLSIPLAVVSRLQAASDNGKRHDLHGPSPQAQLQYSNLAGKMLRMVNELRATGQLGMQRSTVLGKSSSIRLSWLKAPLTCVLACHCCRC